jgi:hypothetical protein
MSTNKQTKKTETPFGALTTVKTVYARAVILLLAFNFCLTGYAVYSLAQIQADSYSEQSETPIQEVQSASTE